MEPTLRIDPKALGDVPLFSAAQAREWSISDKDLRILVRREQLRRVDRGWYSTRVCATPEEEHVLRTVAALLQHDEAVASHHSAALIHGLPLARADLGTVELTRTRPGHGRTRAGLRVRSAGDVPTVTVEEPLTGRTVRAVDVAHAVVGAALSNNPVAGLVAGDHALREGRCSADEIHEALHRLRLCTGIRVARQALAHLEPRHESPGETLTGWELRQLGWDLVPQWVVVARGRLYRLDFRVRGHLVAIEFDGQVKYTSPEVMQAQQRREDDLRSLGWVFVRITWDDLADPAEVSRRIRAAIAEAAAA